MSAALLKISSVDESETMRFSTATGMCLIMGGGGSIGYECIMGYQWVSCMVGMIRLQGLG